MNILICDDDKYVRKMLEKITAENTLVSKIFIAEDGLEAVKIAGNKKIDIALLDIDMPNLDGIETAKIINKIFPKVKFIFITAYMEYAVDSFSVHPYDYILKPVDILKFKNTLNDLITMQIKERNDNSIDKIVIKNKREILVVSLKDILYFEKVDRDVLAHTNKEVYTLNKTLAELENSSHPIFCRAHQSFIVNIEKIKKIKDMGNRSYQIEFLDSKKVAFVSRYKFEELKNKIVTSS